MFILFQFKWKVHHFFVDSGHLTWLLTHYHSMIQPLKHQRGCGNTIAISSPSARAFQWTDICNSHTFVSIGRWDKSWELSYRWTLYSVFKQTKIIFLTVFSCISWSRAAWVPEHWLSLWMFYMLALHYWWPFYKCHIEIPTPSTRIFLSVIH